MSADRLRLLERVLRGQGLLKSPHYDEVAERRREAQIAKAGEGQ